MMKENNTKLIGGMLTLAVVLATVTGQAQTSQPSSKVTAKTANLILVKDSIGTAGWQTLFSNTIKTANQKDLFISASFEVGLYTDTLVSSKNMVKDTSSAEATVQIQVLLDGKAVEPGSVVYGRRKQTLSATLEGAIGTCLTNVVNSDGTTSIVVDETCVLPEVIELILDTMDAASFNFVAVDVPQGVHTISVQAGISTTTTTTTPNTGGSASAHALVGKGSMTVESVRLIKDPNVEVAQVP
jgi:hypothetical protein